MKEGKDIMKDNTMEVMTDTLYYSQFAHLENTEQSFAELIKTSSQKLDEITAEYKISSKVDDAYREFMGLHERQNFHKGFIAGIKFITQIMTKE